METPLDMVSAFRALPTLLRGALTSIGPCINQPTVILEVVLEREPGGGSIQFSADMYCYKKLYQYATNENEQGGRR